MNATKQSSIFSTESDKDYYIYQVIHGESILLPSHIRELKQRYKNDIYNIIRYDYLLEFLSAEFKTESIIDYIDIDLC